jgi:hypothetical protein
VAGAGDLFTSFHFRPRPWPGRILAGWSVEEVSFHLLPVGFGATRAGCFLCSVLKSQVDTLATSRWRRRRRCHEHWSATVRGRAITAYCTNCCPKASEVRWVRSGVVGYRRQPLLVDARPDLVEQWDGRLNGRAPELIRLGSSKKVWWVCEKNHHWQATVSNRVYRGSGCPVCAQNARRAPAPGRSVAEAAPELAAQWHPWRNSDLRPEQVSINSRLVVWWRCEEGHEWRSRVSGRARRRGRCPTCAQAARRGQPRGAAEVEDG